MPLPLFIGIGLAVATGGVGLGKGIKAGADIARARSINRLANETVQEAAEKLNLQRAACSRSLEALGEEKLFVLNSSIHQFLDSFSKIKNAELLETEGLEELRRFHVDAKDFAELKLMVNYAGAAAGGVLAGGAGGALVAFGAYGAAQAFACASTGTAIAALHGAAATNATLAFFGGGSLAAGGLGVAGGAAVLGGLVAGPALLAVGFIMGQAAGKDLNKALENQAEARKMTEELSAGALQCEAIRRRTYMFYHLLARLDARFLPLLYQMEEIIRSEGCDYRFYTPASKKAIASCAGLAVTIKSVLDTPILTDDGLLTPESEAAGELVRQKLEQA